MYKQRVYKYIEETNILNILEKNNIDTVINLFSNIIIKVIDKAIE